MYPFRRPTGREGRNEGFVWLLSTSHLELATAYSYTFTYRGLAAAHRTLVGVLARVLGNVSANTS